MVKKTDPPLQEIGKNEKEVRLQLVKIVAGRACAKVRELAVGACLFDKLR